MKLFASKTYIAHSAANVPEDAARDAAEEVAELANSIKALNTKINIVIIVITVLVLAWVVQVTLGLPDEPRAGSGL